jgi:tetratricopeptide (TPR) repeat protein
MPIEGSLREFALTDIFQLLHLSRKTGELRIVREPSGSTGLVIFNHGTVVGTILDEASPRLGYMLLNAGKITEADLHRADQLHSEDPSRSWTDILTSMEVVESSEMDRFIRFQVEETAYEILGWEDGKFSFEERDVDDAECVTLIPVESILMEGARRADEMSALATTIESPTAVPRLSDRAGEGGMIDLAPEEWEILGRIDGTSDVKSIAWTLGRNEVEVSKIISKLAELSLVEIGDEEEIARTRPPHEVSLDEAEGLLESGEVREARRHITSVLKRHPEEPRAHLLAARALERSGDWLGATEAYERTLAIDPLAVEARQRLGLVRLKMGDIEGAAREWTAYLRMAPDSLDKSTVNRAIEAVRELQIVLDVLDGREDA